MSSFWLINWRHCAFCHMVTIIICSVCNLYEESYIEVFLYHLLLLHDVPSNISSVFVQAQVRIIDAMSSLLKYARADVLNHHHIDTQPCMNWIAKVTPLHLCTLVQIFLFELQYTLGSCCFTIGLRLASSCCSLGQHQLSLSSSLPQTLNNLSFHPACAKINFSVLI